MDEPPRKLQKIIHPSLENERDQIETTIEMTTESASPKDAVAKSQQEKIAIGSASPMSAETPVLSQETSQPMSKNQLKKLRRKEAWEAGRESRKAKRKEKVQEKKQRKKEQKAEAKENIAKGLAPPVQPKQIRHVQVPVTFVIDCNYDDLMLRKEQISLSAQLTRSYSDNLKAPFRAHMAVTSFGGSLKERYETLLNSQYKNWRGVKFLEEDFAVGAEQAQERMQKPDSGKIAGALSSGTAEDPKQQGEIIYLSSDSTETLTELKPYSTYIIGGIVDKNRHKGICHKAAVAKGIKTARLPIGEYMEMTSRYILATNHVVEILLKWLEVGDWGQAFLAVMPPRKKGVLKKSSADDEHGAEEAQGLVAGAETVEAAEDFEHEGNDENGEQESLQMQHIQDLQEDEASEARAGARLSTDLSDSGIPT